MEFDDNQLLTKIMSEMKNTNAKLDKIAEVTAAIDKILLSVIAGDASFSTKKSNEK